MAKKITTTVTDDLDGSANARSIRFGLDGVLYSIDLSARNEKKLRDSLHEFINHAARQRSAGTSKPATVRGARDYDIAALRAWAAKKSIELPARGRIPAAIIEQYKATGGR